MAVRFVSCDFCGRVGDSSGMVTCPACGKSLCPECAVEAPQQAGCCGRRECCTGQTPHPAAERVPEPEQLRQKNRKETPTPWSKVFEVLFRRKK